MKSLTDFCKNCGLIMILEEQIGPHIKKIGKIGLTRVFPYNTDNPDEAEAYLVDEFTLEDADEVYCPKCEAGLLYEDDETELEDTCSICKKPEPGQYFQGGGGVCYNCEETLEGSTLLEQSLKNGNMKLQMVIWRKKLTKNCRSWMPTILITRRKEKACWCTYFIIMLNRSTKNMACKIC